MTHHFKSLTLDRFGDISPISTKRRERHYPQTIVLYLCRWDMSEIEYARVFKSGRKSFGPRGRDGRLRRQAAMARHVEAEVARRVMEGISGITSRMACYGLSTINDVATKVK
jgi:hypothetical protein